MASPHPHSVVDQPLWWADLGRRDELLVTGPDAGTFVENFTTAAISRLEPGSGCDGFFCDARGWVLELALIWRLPDGLLLNVESGHAAPLHRHLDRYHIREQLELVDRSGQTDSLLLAGAAADEWLRLRFDQPLPAGLYQFVEGRLAAAPGEAAPLSVRLTRIDWYGRGGYLLETAADGRLAQDLGAAGLPRAAAQAVTALRLLHGWPVAADIPEKTLPQELGLDDRAISFTKGCYLGQETVARLDALGHVNRRLTLLAVAGDDALAVGAAVTCGAATVATVSSTAPELDGAGWLAVAIVPLKAVAAAEPLLVSGRPAAARPFPTAATEQPRRCP